MSIAKWMVSTACLGAISCTLLSGLSGCGGEPAVTTDPVVRAETEKSAANAMEAASKQAKAQKPPK